MLQSPGYFNSSLWDTLSGEYYRSFTTKSDYYHIFDYWRWDENTHRRHARRNTTGNGPPTRTTTWRIGDGTAAFYNYVYYTVAGFTEHDTFRSNQVREGEMTREDALDLGQGRERSAIPQHQVVPRRRRYGLRGGDQDRQFHSAPLRAVTMTHTIWYISKYVAPPQRDRVGGRGYELMRELAAAGTAA